MKEVHIDGSWGEGGGQVLRTSLTMSAITGRPVRIENIRAGRKKPGLAAQHVTSIKAIASLMSAHVEGARIGSKEVFFSPGAPQEGVHQFDVGTAGSVTLVLQTVLPAALIKRIEACFLITGGTDVPWSPASAYFERVYCAMLSRMGFCLESRVLAHGFYPKGGGRMEVVTRGEHRVCALDLSERGREKGVFLTSIASGHLRQARVAERQVVGFSKRLKDFTVENIEYADSISPGSLVFARAVYENTVLGATALGERGKPAEQVGKSCAAELAEELRGDGTLDVHMSDQALIYLAVLGGTLRTREITLHTRTNAQVLGEFGYGIGFDPPKISATMKTPPLPEGSTR